MGICILVALQAFEMFMIAPTRHLAAGQREADLIRYVILASLIYFPIGFWMLHLFSEANRHYSFNGDSL
jgi:hypothetical protein